MRNCYCDCEMRPDSFPLPQIYDPNSNRFEVPHEHISSLPSNPSIPISSTLQVTQKPFGLTVRRKENQKVV